MKRLIALSAILLPICLFSQGFGIFSRDQPFFAKDISTVSSPTNSLLAGIGYWWVASDLTNSPVTTWTDRVSGFILKQPTVANQPTWSTNGVRFAVASTQYLVTNGSPPIVWRLGPSVDYGDAILVILDRASTGDTTVIGPTTPGGRILAFDFGANAWDNGSGSQFGITTTGQWYDYLYAGTNFAGAYATYTNGVLAFTGAASKHSPHIFGGGSSGASFDGTIKEIIVWTNIAGTTSLQASNIHWYATNTYKYSP